MPYFMLAARDAKLNNYYYGVLPSEATPDRPAYEPGSGVNATLGLNARYDFTNHWHFLAGISAARWAGGVQSGMATGPIVRDVFGSATSDSARNATVSAAPASGGSGAAPSSAAPATNAAQAARSDAAHPNRRAACAKTKQCSATAPVTCSVEAAVSAAKRFP